MKIEREIRNDHIARIEGKAGVVVELGDEITAKINVTEGPRFFEMITRGKTYEDAATICSRICSFCSVPHKLTAVAVAEDALGVEVSEQTTILRDMLYFGNMVESHALHLYLFVAPDYLGYPSAFAMAEKYPQLMKHGLELKSYGAMVQSILGSREIHPENAVVGGFGRLPEKSDMERILKSGTEALQAAVATVDFFAEYEYPAHIDLPRNHLAIRPHRGYSVYGDGISASDGFSFDIEKYREFIQEEVVPHSFAKHSRYRESPFMVGALSRLINNSPLLDGTAKELLSTYRSLLREDNCFANNFAQAIEMVYFIEKINEMAERLTVKKEERVQPEASEGKGYAVTEAPRGLLIYEMELENGRVASLNVITPTAMFLPMMEVDVRNMAKGMWESGYKDPDLIGNKVEMTIRAYDPCISCSVHVVRL